MTFLELCVRVAEKCSITGTISTTVSQTGEFLRVVNWVNEAWRDIQLSQSNWDWMADDFSFQTVAGQQSYTPTTIGAAEFSKWLPDTFRIYLTSTGVSDDTFLTESSYQSFRDLYMFGVQAQNKPSEFAIKRNGKNILLGSIPDAIYTVYGEYQRRATLLAGDDDEPDMEEEYHMLVVHGARMKYAAYESAPEVWDEAKLDYDRMMSRMAEAHIDELGLGNPLA